MTSIKGPGGPQIPLTPGTTESTPVKQTEAAAPVGAPKDSFGAHGAAAEQGPPANPLTSAAPTGGSLLGGLALIASLRQHPLFGAGARTKPLKLGQTALEGEVDAEHLAEDLAAFFDGELSGADEPKRAAINSLFGGYPGGRDALGPITDALT